MLKILFVISFLFLNQFAYATFSMVAIDAKTNQSGSVLASCIDDDLYFANDLVDAVVYNGNSFGIMNTQATIGTQDDLWYTTAEQIIFQNDPYYTASFILEHLSNPSMDLDFQSRQYLLVKKDLKNNMTSATFTGNKVPDVKFGINGKSKDNRFGYAIAGNILTNAETIKTMEKTFLKTPGTLYNKLLHAINSVSKNPNLGDNRCQKLLISSNVAFVRVFQNNNSNTNLDDYKIIHDHFVNTKKSTSTKDAASELYRMNCKKTCN